MGLTESDQKTVEPADHSARVRQMFARIAGHYDLLNHLLSANTDRRWRRTVASTLGQKISPGATVLDVACGTGDLSIQLFEDVRAKVIGVDFCRPMLEIAGRKTGRIPFVEADALDLPFAEGAFDAVTIAFGLRNLANTSQGLNELRRVLKPGGWLAVLEFSRPQAKGFRWLFEFYFTRLLPRIGGLVSGSQGAYQYLPDSVSRFPDQVGLATLMREAGYDEVDWENLTGGVAALHLAKRPSRGHE
ncbi:MAG: bifunctional demethylmenaquinone methyltransferase/2-methoxy-6-polyprenyl-1,4-benzoquinol methylase UbiE [Pyrinomonadaceae bacterium]